MGSYNDVSQKELEDELVDAGTRLFINHASATTDELLVLLEKAESALSKVWQESPRSTANALHPALKALVTDKLLRHSNLNIQVAVASCINELTRITAPNPPYNDDLMKEAFRLFMIAFKQLYSDSRSNYVRALQILQTVATVKSFVIMLDMDSDEMIIEMFELFLNTVRSKRSTDIFKFMERIMTSLIEESDEISAELLRPLLDSVRISNKESLPISWELGKTVFENCAGKLRPCLIEAVKLMNIDFRDYADIVASLCKDTSSGKDTVVEEVAAAVQSVVVGPSSDGLSMLDSTSEAKQEDCAPRMNGKDGNVSDDYSSLEKLKCCQQIVQLNINNATSDCGAANVSETVLSETETGALRTTRDRKPNSVLKPEEGYVGSEHKLVRTKKKGSMINHDKNLDLSAMPRQKKMKSKVSERGSDASKKSIKKVITGSGDISLGKGSGIDGDNDSDGKEKVLLQELCGRNETRDDIISQKNQSRDFADKFESPLTKPGKAKKEKARTSPVDCGEELIHARIKVWWPIDKTFYTGTIEAFDPSTKKHRIKYDDDEEEILNLSKERWELFNEERPRQPQSSCKQEADHQSPAKELVKTPKKNAKRKGGSLKKQAASSSKRSKGKSGSQMTSEDSERSQDT